MIENSQRTIYNLELVKAFSCGRHYTPLKNTTLNEKFNILPDTQIPKGFYPRMKYFVIGIGGDETIENLQGFTLSRHCATDAALFHHIPFVLREIDNDLRPAERKEYRLRNEITIDDRTYFAYWGKVTDNIDYAPYLFRVDKRNGSDILSLFKTDTDELLKPTPKRKPKQIKDILTTSTIISKYSISFYLSPFDQDELRNVFKILKLRPETKITELGLCHGYDVIHNGFDEVISTQIAVHVDLNLDTLVEFDARETFKKNIVLGGSEPLFIGQE